MRLTTCLWVAAIAVLSWAALPACGGSLAVALDSTTINFYDTETGTETGTFDMTTVEPFGSIYCLDYDADNGDLWVGLQGGTAENPVSDYVHVLRDVDGTLQSVHSFSPIPRSGANPNVYDIEVVAGLDADTPEVYVSNNWRYAYHVSLTHYDGTNVNTCFTTDTGDGKGFEGLTTGTGNNLWLMTGASHRNLNNRLYDRSTVPGSSSTLYPASSGDAGRGATFYPGTVTINEVEATGVVLVGFADMNNGRIDAYAEDGSYLGQFANYKFGLFSAKGVRDLEIDEDNAVYTLSIRDSGDNTQFRPQVAKYVYDTDTATTFHFFETGTVLNAVSYYLPPATILGDVNGDGVVDGLDIQPFVDLLTGGGYQAEADINEDTVVDGLDIQPFVDIITGAGGNPVPEPATLSLLAIGGVALLRRRMR